MSEVIRSATITYTPEARDKLAAHLDTHEIPAGLGTEESACSIAAINLALTGEMSDGPIDCMSEVIRRATIILQDAIPDEMRNSARNKTWLVNAHGTGRANEEGRLGILMDWMWGTVLRQVQPLADEKGFGDQWRAMCENRTAKAAACAPSRSCFLYTSPSPRDRTRTRMLSSA